MPRAFWRLVSKRCDECKGSFARGCETKRWSHWTCSSLGTIFQPMRINSVPDVKCFCINKNVLRSQSMVWHFVRHPVYSLRIKSFCSIFAHVTSTSLQELSKNPDFITRVLQIIKECGNDWSSSCSIQGCLYTWSLTLLAYKNSLMFALTCYTCTITTRSHLDSINMKTVRRITSPLTGHSAEQWRISDNMCKSWLPPRGCTQVFTGHVCGFQGHYVINAEGDKICISLHRQGLKYYVSSSSNLR